MATPSTLNTLIDLANKETEEAAKLLGATLRAGEEAEQKLDLLMQYRDDYSTRCQASLSAGISTTQFNNFQVFMEKLEHAIAGQKKVVADAGQRIAQARATWQACEQKKRSFSTLADRASKAEARREIWLDQKQNDEHAARRALFKRNPS